MTWNRVWAIGGETYLRVYPNPGFGICLWGSKRLAISWYGGIEVFRRHPRYVWQRTYAKFSRIKRLNSVRS